MQPQLAAVELEFVAAVACLKRLQSAVPPERWSVRADPERWSVGECVVHLNLTSLAYRPILTEAIADAKHVGGKLPTRLRRDPIGWLLWRSMPPPVRTRMKTLAAFIPEATAPAGQLVREFEELQDEQIGFVHAADGLPIQNVRIISPFNAKIKYNLYSCFTILAAHQHRHLWQAEQVWR